MGVIAPAAPATPAASPTPAAPAAPAAPAPAAPTAPAAKPAAPTPAPAPTAAPAAPPTSAASPATDANGSLGSDPAFFAYLRGAGLSQADAQAIAQQGAARVQAQLANNLADQQMSDRLQNLTLGNRLENSGMSNSTTGQFQVIQQNAQQAARREALRQAAAAQTQNLVGNLGLATLRAQTGAANAALSAAPAADATVQAASQQPVPPTSSPATSTPTGTGVGATGTANSGPDNQTAGSNPWAGFGGDQNATLSSAQAAVNGGSPPTFGQAQPAAPAAATGPTGLVAPFPAGVQVTTGRVDEGQDMQAPPNTPVLAGGSGTIEIHQDPNGFGTYPVLILDTPIDGNTGIYYGHIGADLPAGTHVQAGQQLGHTLQVPGGNATQPGWLEIGWWGPHGPTGNGQAMAQALAGAAPSGANGTLGSDPSYLAYLRGAGLSLAEAQAIADQTVADIKGRLANSLADQQRNNMNSNLNLGTRLEAGGLGNSTTGQFLATTQNAQEAARQEALRQTAMLNIDKTMQNLGNAVQQGQVGAANAALSASPAADGTVTAAASGSVPQAILAATPDRRVELAMLVGSKLESGWNPQATGDGGGSVGPFQINHNNGMHSDISMAASEDPAQAAVYMLAAYKQAVAQVPASLWASNPEQAAEQAAYLAERPLVTYHVSQGQAAVDAAYQAALQILGGGGF